MKVEADEEIVETGLLDVRSLNKKKTYQSGNNDDARNVSEEFDLGTG